MNYRKKILILFFLTLSFLFNDSIVAQSTRDKQVSNYLFEFGRYLRWKDDYNITLIKIGVLNGSESFLTELRRITKNGYDREIFIEVLNFGNINDIKETHLLFLPKAQNSQFSRVNRRIYGFNTALVTEELSEKKKIMINIVKKGGQYSFELNGANLKTADVNYESQIKQLGGTIISAQDLIDESEEMLNKERAKSESLLKQIKKYQKDIKKQEEDLAKQKEELEAQKDKLLSQADDIVAQERRIRKQKAELVEIEESAQKTLLALEEKTAELRKKEESIAEKERVIEKNKEILKEQQDELKLGQERIDKMNSEIADMNKQITALLIYKNLALIISVVAALFLVMLFFILRGYRIKKRDNKLLAEQKAEIESINTELEKLSIVASETSNAVVILDTKGRFEWVNVGFTKMYGYTLEELKSEVHPDIYGASKRPNIEELVEDCLTNAKTVIYESSVTTRSDEEMWAQTTITPIVGEDSKVTKLVLIDSDISKIKEAEAEIIRQSQKISLQAQELEKQNVELEKLSLVASKTDNSVIIANVDGDIEWVNDGFTRLLGQTFDEFSKQYGNNIFKSSLNPRLREQLQSAVSERRSIIYSSKTATIAGKQLWIQTTMTPIFDNDGKLSKYIAIDADITKIKLAEEEIKKQKQNITDSIIYAQKIQEAVLPPEEYLSRLLPEHFIMFRPKDIVSGDFYWASHKGDKVLIAAADCTGHGVPGGFMSMLGMTFLNEITGRMNEHELSAGKVLTLLRESVKNSLRQTGKEGEAKDGMDIALCIIDKKTNELQFAGANNPLFIVREHKDEIEIINVKADEMPIGIFYDEKASFTNHKIQLLKGDLCYIFSDGYPDQFGGKKGRKFMAKRFKNMLAIHSDKTMPGQKEVVENAFDKWKGKHRQIDDVLVIGLKV